MKLSKNVYDAKAPTKNLVTTITGVIALIIPILAAIGLITPEQSVGLTTQLGIVGTAITGIIGAISAIILIFKAQDPV